jgi:hypothetical protein
VQFLHIGTVRQDKRMAIDTHTKTRANRARRYLSKDGYILYKSRARVLSRDNQGGYTIANDRNHCVAGASYELTLDDVEDFIAGLRRKEDAA